VVKTREEYLALGMIEMRYQLDDDFDAAEVEAEWKTCWVVDASKNDVEVCGKGFRVEIKDAEGKIKYELKII
jgi:hypothetical protein